MKRMDPRLWVLKASVMSLLYLGYLEIINDRSWLRFVIIFSDISTRAPEPMCFERAKKARSSPAFHVIDQASEQFLRPHQRIIDTIRTSMVQVDGSFQQTGVGNWRWKRSGRQRKKIEHNRFHPHTVPFHPTTKHKTWVSGNFRSSFWKTPFLVISFHRSTHQRPFAALVLKVVRFSPRWQSNGPTTRRRSKLCWLTSARRRHRVVLRLDLALPLHELVQNRQQRVLVVVLSHRQHDRVVHENVEPVQKVPPEARFIRHVLEPLLR